MLNQQLNAFQGEEHQPFTLHGGDAAALLVHGFPGSPAEMRPIGRVLHDAGFTVRGVLLPGFGPDVETLADRTSTEWRHAVMEELADLQREHETVLLVGNSMGGALCIQIAAMLNQRIDGVILISPFWKVQHIVWATMPLLRIILPQPRIFRYLKLDFDDPKVREGIHNFMPEADLDDPEVQQAIRDMPMPIKMFAQIHRAGHEAYRLADKVRVPALVIQGLHDDLVKPDLTRQMIARFQAPVHYYTFDADHDLIDPSQPTWDDIQAVIQQFAHPYVKVTS
jgi:carboxylesterase